MVKELLQFEGSSENDSDVGVAAEVILRYYNALTMDRGSWVVDAGPSCIDM